MDGPLPDWIEPSWDRFFFKEKEPDFDVFEGDLFPLQRRKEMEAMLNMVGMIPGRPLNMMEIGTDKGSLLYHFCERFPLNKAVGCEIRGTPFAGPFERRFPHTKFLWLACSSLDLSTVTRVQDFLAGDRLDVLFIDGDKSYFLQDFELYLPLMSTRGIVFMHDITDMAPGEAYRTVRARGFRTFDLIDTSEVLPLFLRKPANGHEAWLAHWMGRSCGIGCIFMKECGIGCIFMKEFGR
jgi:hypothetical protein